MKLTVSQSAGHTATSNQRNAEMTDLTTAYLLIRTLWGARVVIAYNQSGELIDMIDYDLYVKRDEYPGMLESFKADAPVRQA